VESSKERGRSKVDSDTQPLSERAAPSVGMPDENMLLANYTLGWLERYKLGKIRPSSFER